LSGDVPPDRRLRLVNSTPSLGWSAVPGIAPQYFSEGEKFVFQNILRMIFGLAVVFVPLLVPCGVSAQAVTAYPGTLLDGATYLIEVPPNCNGTLFLDFGRSCCDRASLLDLHRRR
jgi:hypothetical protein